MSCEEDSKESLSFVVVVEEEGPREFAMAYMQFTLTQLASPDSDPVDVGRFHIRQ